MKITIETIPQAKHRYPTAGDWFWQGQDLVILVTETMNWRLNGAVAVHELVEALLCRNDGVPEPDITAFDIAYENDREPGDDSEPGDAADAPYTRQHCFATAVERMLIAAFGLSWDEYGKAMEAV
jgi:hypothetical protein